MLRVILLSHRMSAKFNCNFSSGAAALYDDEDPMELFHMFVCCQNTKKCGERFCGDRHRFNSKVFPHLLSYIMSVATNNHIRRQESNGSSRRRVYDLFTATPKHKSISKVLNLQWI